MSGPSVVQSASQPCTDTNSPSITLGSSPTPGNILVAFISFSQYPSARTINTPSGWTLIDDTTDNTSIYSQATFWHLVQSGDGATWGWTLTSSGSDDCSGALYEISGASTTSPVNQHAAGSNPISASFTTPSVTPSVLNCLPLTGTCVGRVGTSVTSSSSGWTVDVAQLSSSQGTVAAHQNTLTSDTVTAVSFTCTDSDYGGEGVSEILLIAPPGTPPTPVYPLQQPVQAKRPLVLKAGTIDGEFPGPAGNIPGPLNWLGGGLGANGAPVKNPTKGPVFRQAVTPARARIPQVFSKGRVYSNTGAPVHNPTPGPVFHPAVQALRARLPQQPLLRGRISSNPGAPVRNPTAGPAFRQRVTPARSIIPPPLPRRGRVASNPGAPIRNPQPGPVFAQRTSPPPVRPLPRRGTCRAIRFYLLSPGTGPVFTQATTPARSRVTLPPRGRIGSNPGSLIPAAPPAAASLRQLSAPVRIRPVLPPRGRSGSNPGAPVRNPAAGPAFRQRSFVKAQPAARPGRVYAAVAAPPVASAVSSISVVQSSAFNNAFSGTLGSNVTAGNTVFLVVTASTSGSGYSTSDPTLGGNPVPGASLLIEGFNSGGDISAASIWMLPDCPGGSGAVAVTVTGGTANIYCGLAAYEVSGLGKAPSLDTSSGTSGFGTTPDSGSTGAITTSPEFILGVVAYNAGVISGPAGWTNLIIGPPTAAGWAGYQVASSSGGSYDYSGETTQGFGNWYSAVVAVKPAGGSPVPPAPVYSPYFATGRISFSYGAPVENPPPVGPPFRQKPYPARIRPVFPPAGRISSNPGGPVRNPLPPVPPPVPQTVRIWEGNPPPYTPNTAESGNYVLGTQFAVSLPCTLYRIWWYSPADAVALPQYCGIWNTDSQSLVTESAFPEWLDPDGSNASPGDGWVYCDFSALQVAIIPGINYVASVFQADSGDWWITTADYWTAASGLPGQNGITNAPISAPNTENSVNGQGCYDTSGMWQFPGSNPGNGEVFYVDAELIPPVTVSPAVSIRAKRLPFSVGRVISSYRGPVKNPTPGPVFTQKPYPARIRPNLPPRGRIASSPGAPARNPGAGPAFRQAVHPTRAQFPLPHRGRIYSSAGAPVTNPQKGPVFYPKNFTKAQQPLPRRGVCRSIKFYPVQTQPAVGVPFTSRTTPVQARIPLPHRGRIYSSAGAPVTNPQKGPVFRQATSPARVRITPPPRGRIAFNPGGPPRNVSIGPVFIQKPYPVQARIPQIAPRGRIYSHAGAPVKNPQSGPVFIQAVHPARTRIPQNAPRGRTSGNPGGPVANVPVNRILISTGDLFVLWETGDLTVLWETGDLFTSQ